MVLADCKKEEKGENTLIYVLVLWEYFGAWLISQNLKLDTTKIKSGLCLKDLLILAVVQIICIDKF